MDYQVQVVGTAMVVLAMVLTSFLPCCMCCRPLTDDRLQLNSAETSILDYSAWWWWAHDPAWFFDADLPHHPPPALSRTHLHHLPDHRRGGGPRLFKPTTTHKHKTHSKAPPLRHLAHKLLLAFKPPPPATLLSKYEPHSHFPLEALFDDPEYFS
ncbi:hypothetical protein GOP47_0015110 [Adiantum capillus-veneris]|uniref:Uncharacterized protein n=1 Tax=Adiantum capillus-veneris TaxID=13818 RepID=A0A9D4UNM3_ADICA|nr:hypothetical protein GOP47_0015110 [Adiantum capillus-veneris]